MREHPSRHSLLYIPHQFIVPGGRFRELYYWDAYWIIKGLLASGMRATSKSIIRNFVHLIDVHGFVPNANRCYYLQRSQPPLLTAMVYEYYEDTADLDFVREVMPRLEAELDFWRENRRVKVELGGMEHEVGAWHTRWGISKI